MVVADNLMAAGFVVVVAATADEAMLVLEANASIRAMFTDVQMPGSSIDGLQLARVVRRRWPCIRIVIASGNLAFAAGDAVADVRFLAKPYPAAVDLTPS